MKFSVYVGLLPFFHLYGTLLRAHPLLVAGALPLVMLDIVLARLFRHSVADDRLRAEGLSRPTGLEGTRPTASDGLSRSAGLDGAKLKSVCRTVQVLSSSPQCSALQHRKTQESA